MEHACYFFGHREINETEEALTYACKKGCRIIILS